MGVPSAPWEVLWETAEMEKNELLRARQTRRRPEGVSVTEKLILLQLQYYIPSLYKVLGPEELTFSSAHIFGDRTVRSSLQETVRKLNKISTDVLLDPRRLGNAVAITPICTADGRERAWHEEHDHIPISCSLPHPPLLAQGACEHH